MDKWSAIVLSVGWVSSVAVIVVTGKADIIIGITAVTGLVALLEFFKRI